MIRAGSRDPPVGRSSESRHRGGPSAERPQQLAARGAPHARALAAADDDVCVIVREARARDGRQRCLQYQRLAQLRDEVAGT